MWGNDFEILPHIIGQVEFQINLKVKTDNWNKYFSNLWIDHKSFCLYKPSRTCLSAAVARADEDAFVIF